VFVIPRLDRGIQCFHEVLDCPLKPDNDKIKVFLCRVNSKYAARNRSKPLVEFFFYSLIVSTIIAVAFSLFYWIKEKKDNRRGNGND
jgi:hypothetical protein